MRLILFFVCLFSKEKERQGMELSGGEEELWKGNWDQNILYEILFMLLEIHTNFIYIYI